MFFLFLAVRLRLGLNADVGTTQIQWLHERHSIRVGKSLSLLKYAASALESAEQMDKSYGNSASGLAIWKE
jgi:hypothetical protein